MVDNCFNIVFSIYLILTMFKKEENIEEKNLKKEKKTEVKQTKEHKKEEKFTQREKEFLYKKTLKTKADLLVEK